MSLAEELQAAVLAADKTATQAKSTTELRQCLTLPLGVSLDSDRAATTSRRGCNVGISQFLINISELGSPDQIDPVNKYRDVVCDMAYGCVCLPAEDEHRDRRSLTATSPSLSSPSSSSSGMMSNSIEGKTEINDDAIAMTRIPSMTSEQYINDDNYDGDVINKNVTSRVIECLPDVIAATVGAASRNDRLHSDADDQSCSDVIAAGSSQSSKKNSLHSGYVDKTVSVESSRKFYLL